MIFVAEDCRINEDTDAAASMVLLPYNIVI